MKRTLSLKKAAAIEIEPETDLRDAVLESLREPEWSEITKCLGIMLGVAAAAIGSTKEELVDKARSELDAFWEIVMEFNETIDTLRGWLDLCEAAQARQMIALAAVAAGPPATGRKARNVVRLRPRRR